MKFRPLGAELFHADGQTDIHDEANTRFSQAPNMFDYRSNWYVV